MNDHPSTLYVNTTRFGQLAIAEPDIITFPQGIIGFPECQRFTLLPHKPGSPFVWLQSLDAGELAFVILNPRLVAADYLQSLTDDEISSTGLLPDHPLDIWVIVTILPGEPLQLTANLLGPVIIDRDTRTGCQVILSGSNYTTRHPILPSAEASGR